MIEIRHGILVLRPAGGDEYEVVHFCGYEEEPTEDDVAALREELTTDPEFELKITDDLIFMPAPDYIVDEYRQILADTDAIYEEHELN